MQYKQWENQNRGPRDGHLPGEAEEAPEQGGRSRVRKKEEDAKVPGSVRLHRAAGIVKAQASTLCEGRDRWRVSNGERRDL